MKKKIFSLLIAYAFLSSFTPQKPLALPPPSSTHALFHSLDPTSISQHIAFYKLYSDTPEGKKAYERVCELLQQSNAEIKNFLPKVEVEQITSLIQEGGRKNVVCLTKEELDLIEILGKKLHNRKLQTFDKWDEKDFINAPSCEIDIARALFVAENAYTKSSDEEKKLDVKSYEALLDIMALQIIANLPKDASDEEKIETINNYIFYEMRFRFPPHSLHAKQIDTYTFLPSVLDSRRGVCLGVTTLYLCLAQRIGLVLEAITPPGHIFPSYQKKDGNVINIETTARGIDLPSEVYLGIETLKLQKRDNKELIGLVFINQASVFWQNKKYKKAISLYEQAAKYLPNDALLKELLGYNYLFVGKNNKGKKLLKEANKIEDEFSVSKNTITEDFLKGRVNAKGIEVIFLSVDETRKSILHKQKKLKRIVKKFPKFRAGLMQYATTFLQLGREKEAFAILTNYEKIDAKEPIVNYYLAVISYERYDYNKAWKYLGKAKKELEAKSHFPKAIQEFEQVLRKKCPNRSS